MKKISLTKFNLLFFLMILSGYFFSGCATTYNLENCSKMNWNSSGFEDAVNGEKPNRKALQECGEHVNYDHAAAEYTKGYSSGLNQFCTAENGFSWGNLGREYSETCPVVNEKKFLSGYKSGKQAFEEAEVERKKRESLNQAGGSCTTDSDCEVLFKCEAFVCQPR